MSVQHINITMPVPLRIELDRWAKREHTKRSTLIQKAVQLYLELVKRKKIAQLLRQGYAEMAEEMKEINREFECLDRESLQHVD